MTRFAWALAAVLAASSAVSARQNGKIPNFHPTEKGAAQPIPSWDIHGLAETIPNLTARALVETSTSIWRPLPGCLIVARHGRKYDYIHSVGSYPVAPSKKQLRDRDLKAFRQAGGRVRILPSRYSQSELATAEDACMP